MGARELIGAWGWLVGLSAMTTALTLFEPGGDWRIAVAACVLALAGLKGRIILTRYLKIGASRFWTGAFDVVLGAFLALGFAAYLIGTGGS
ncbi:MAG: hypothetical protein JNM89_06260 [Hyphomicrobiaceae bacterium]|nr:hypothetical protein [Hyphomicrobiaceae bacterium]